jgi:hypothetical protein
MWNPDEEAEKITTVQDAINFVNKLVVFGVRRNDGL